MYCNLFNKILCYWGVLMFRTCSMTRIYFEKKEAGVTSRPPCPQRCIYIKFQAHLTKEHYVAYKL